MGHKMQRLGCVAGYDPTILFGTNHIVNGNFELRIIPEGKVGMSIHRKGLQAGVFPLLKVSKGLSRLALL